MDAQAAPPRYQQLADELSLAIHAGRLPSGARLPSLRQMAQQRKVSLNTVIGAYRQLEDAGLVVPLPRSGFKVAARLQVPRRSLRDAPSGADGGPGSTSRPAGSPSPVAKGPRYGS